jgi:DNA-binding transcriptional LysR family regulator
MAIKFLRTLIAISEKGNFSDAADQVCVTPAAVSQQMKRLEEMLDVELFDRNRRTPELTLTGKVLVPRAREIVRSYDSMLNDVKNEYPMSGEFTIGTVSSSLAILLPVSIKALLNNYPEIHIRLLTAPSHDLLPQLDRGAIDAAIMSKPLQLRNHFKWQTFAEEDMVVMCSKELESNDPFELLKNNPYIRMSRHTVVGVMSDDILQDANINIPDTMELESLESITNMVSHNLGVAIVPRPCVMDARHSNLKLISIGSATQSRVMGILSRQDNLKFRMVDGLLDSLKSTIKELQ